MFTMPVGMLHAPLGVLVAVGVVVVLVLVKLLWGPPWWKNKPPRK